MILELDCGNSLIKWRIVNTANEIIMRGASQTLQPLLVDIANSKKTFDFCRLVSVRSEQETASLINQLKTDYGIPIKQVLSCKESLGVKNGYSDYTRLGADRWSAIVAAFHQSQKATLTLGFGTAITSDFIDSQGQHLGGFITPGLLLMRQQLLSNTQRIHYNESIIKPLLTTPRTPGNTTEEAINGGCHLMIQGFITQQVLLTEKYFGQQFDIYVSGGDARHFNIPYAIHKPDLVFEGLSLLCPSMDNP